MCSESFAVKASTAPIPKLLATANAEGALEKCWYTTTPSSPFQSSSAERNDVTTSSIAGRPWQGATHFPMDTAMPYIFWLAQSLMAKLSLGQPMLMPTMTSAPAASAAKSRLQGPCNPQNSLIRLEANAQQLGKAATSSSPGHSHGVPPTMSRVRSTPGRTELATISSKMTENAKVPWPSKLKACTSLSCTSVMTPQLVDTPNGLSTKRVPGGQSCRSCAHALRKSSASSAT
mmetsp:Transcript_131355/g.366215  ORF Transcript_131355/g.366215 Transcript_131355/m.366215 type:complete len:232 (-) Transcript_131355:780-1475(-)